jgi:hypothetical protein
MCRDVIPYRLVDRHQRDFLVPFSGQKRDFTLLPEALYLPTNVHGVTYKKDFEFNLISHDSHIL